MHWKLLATTHGAVPVWKGHRSGPLGGHGRRLSGGVGGAPVGVLQEGEGEVCDCMTVVVLRVARVTGIQQLPLQQASSLALER